METFGNWPESYSPGIRRSAGRGGAPRVPGSSTVKQNFDDVSDPHSPHTDNPENDRRFKDRKCKEITEEQEKALRKAAANQSYDALDGNCAQWAGSTWNSVTGDTLDYGAGNWIYNAPETLGQSIQGQ